MATLPLLVPPPRSGTALPCRWSVPRRVAVSRDPLAEDDPGLERVLRRLAAAGVSAEPVREAGRADLRLELSEELHAQGYRLRLDESGVELLGGSRAGLYYGLCTLEQWLVSRCGTERIEEVPGVSIEDAPNFAERGVMLDVARDRRPTMQTLKALVDRLSSWKYNRLQLYMEADFTYTDCEEALRGRSSYDAAEIGELSRYCRARHVELVPNQQSFGHLHPWLRHERWRELAEVPEGIEHPFSREKEPYGLDPTNPRSLEFLGERYDELLSAFDSDELNVGLDETTDLGEGRSAERCARLGKHRVYVDFLRKVHRLVTERGKRMQFWGDIVLERPEVIDDLPRDAVAMVWGYAADHPFDEELRVFAESGITFDVCPGTSSWNSFGGRTENALGNLRSAARHGAKHGARGVLVTDWGDRGHLQPWPVSYLGWLAGAAFAWSVESADTLASEDFPRLLDLFAFEDEAGVLGRAAFELGRVQAMTGDHSWNGNAQFYLAVFGDQPLPHAQIAGLSIDGLIEADRHLQGCLEGIERARCRGGDAELLRSELELARDLLRFGGALGLARLEAAEEMPLRELPATVRAPLHEELTSLVARHRALWPRRYRPGGLEASASWLEVSLPELR